MVEEMDMGKAATRVLPVQNEAPAFTPGPWAVYRASITYPPETRLPLGTRVMIGIGDADAGGVTDANFALWRSGPELEANARLIAAAPELYAALLEARAALESFDHPNGCGTGLTLVRGGELIGERIDAILSKATGQPRAAANPLIPPTGE